MQFRSGSGVITIGKRIISSYRHLIMSGKLRDIRETASDAVTLVKEIGTPEVRDSLAKVRDTTVQVREIVVLLQTAEMRHTIESISSLAENLQLVSSSLEKMTSRLGSAGTAEKMNKITTLLQDMLDTLRILGSDKEMNSEFKETLVAFRSLIEEVRTSIHDLARTPREISTAKYSDREIRLGVGET